MTTLPVEVMETDCPHCEQPSLTLVFGLEGELWDLEQRCNCGLSEREWERVEDEARAELRDESYPHLRD